MGGNAFGGDMNNQDKYVKYNYNEVYPDRNDPKQVNIMDTREFQDNIDLDKYRDRMNTITQMIVALNDLTGENLDDDDFDAEIYEERHYDTSTCGVKYSEFRRRRFFKSKKGTVKENETTFDINMDEPKKIDALTKWDLTPSENYKSEQKIEHDIHTHSDKFNIKAKVKEMPTDYEITKCKEIVELFPFAFGEDYDPEAEVPRKGGDKFIWDYSYTGDMFFGSAKVKLSWTLYFDDLETAMDLTKKPTHSSEFSIRLYSPNEGYGPYQREVLDWAASVYRGVTKYNKQ